MLTVVQSTQSGDLSDTTTLPAGVAKGNSLLICAGCYNLSGQSAAPTAPALGGVGLVGFTTPLQDLGPVVATNGVGYTFWLYQGLTAAQAGQQVITFTSPTPINGYALELNSGGLPIAVDRTSPAPQNGTATAFDSGPTPAVRFGGEVIVGACPAFGEPLTLTSPGWNVVGEQNFMSLGYQSAAAAGGVYDYAGTIAGDVAWAAGILTLYTPQAAGLDGAARLILGLP